MEDLELDEPSREASGVSDTTSLNLADKKNTDSIIEALDAFLSTPRFDNDVCIILNMPENILKKNKEKLNAGIWSVYNRYAQDAGLNMLDILVAVETMIDSVKLSSILDNDIKLCLAKERGITISENELERIAAMKGKLDEATDESECSDMPDDDAEIMEGLI